MKYLKLDNKMDLREIISRIDNLLERVNSAFSILSIDNKKIRIKELEFISLDQDFWNDTQNAKTLSKELADLREEVSFFEDIKKELINLKEIAKDDIVDKDVSMVLEIEKVYLDILHRFEQKEFYILFRDKYDENNAILSIHAGAGGDDAQDFAQMLVRMYKRFCDKKGFKMDLISETKGGEVGIKSSTFIISGNYAYGYLKSEYGVHRLVRISPFDADHERHTSFVLVEVLPEIEDNLDIKINDDEIRVDTFMSSGAGGQSVNTTYSAVRIVHIPTNITVTCQNERSQAQNKEIALNILKSKLLELKQKEMLDEKNRLKGDYKSIEWGSQIRSYILNPYKLVKDHRTNYETDNVESVLNGNIEEFIEAYLRKKITH